METLQASYRDTLLGNVIPFWLAHGPDHEHGGLLTCLDRDGTVIDTDKAVWLQGRAAWTLAMLHHSVGQNEEWLRVSASCLEFLRTHCRGPGGKLYFTVTREGRPLRMRRYAFSECFAAMGAAAYARAARDARAAEEAVDYFARFLNHALLPGAFTPKVDPETRPMRGLATPMMMVAVGQEVRAALGDVVVNGDTCTGWIDQAIATIRRDFYKPDLGVLMEVVAPDGSIIDHFDGRTLNPGHAIECAWFILHESRLRQSDDLRRLGLEILDGMWVRGWDPEHGGFFNFVDLRGLPVQEYTAEMKFWWPHNEAEIATLLAWRMTGDRKYADWHQDVHDWSRRVFADAEGGEWYGYAHRDGRIATRLKGNLWKGPFHLPRMLHSCWRLVEEQLAEDAAEIPSKPGGKPRPANHS